ncbi:MAG: polyphosphate polymerase domain-containing protein [Anaerolineales bacterium]
MYRNELKFLINAHQKNLMAIKLSKIFQRDPFSDADGGYLISSLYFDDYHQSAFFDKLSGVRDRKKFRVRVYNYQPNVIKLERKIKRVNVIEKSHLQISKEEYDMLICGDVGFLGHKDNLVAKDFYLCYRTKNLRPRVVVEYRREAFIYKFGDVRITFDYSLKAGVFQNDLFSNGYMISAIPQDQIILEVKYTGYIPDIVRNIIQINNLQWQSSSKYAKCFVVGM